MVVVAIMVMVLVRTIDEIFFFALHFLTVRTIAFPVRVMHLTSTQARHSSDSL